MMAEKAQLLTQQHPVGGMVVHHQDPEGLAGRTRGLRRHGLMGQRFKCRQQQLHAHPGALARRAVELQVAAHHHAQAAADHQSQAGAGPGHLPGIVHLSKRLEEALLVFAADADAAVLNHYMQVQLLGGRCIASLKADLYLPVLSELDGVADQIGQYLLEAQRIDQHVGVDSAVQRQHQAEVFLSGQAVEDPDHRLDQLAQVCPLRVEGQTAGFDAGDIKNIAYQVQQVVGRAVGNLDGRAVQFAMVGTFECQLEHADHGIHWGAYFMAHGGQKGTFGPTGRVRLLLGGLQLLNQLATFTDVDPATDDALHFAQRVAEGQYPVINGQLPLTDPQRAVKDQGRTAGHDLLIVRCVFTGFEGIARHACGGALADDIFTSGRERLKVAVVADTQKAFSIAHVDRVRGAVHQRSHEFELIAQRPLGGFALADLPLHPRIPGQQAQQQKARPDQDLVDQALVIVPGRTRWGVGAPSIVDCRQILRSDARQCLVENRTQLDGIARGGHGNQRRVLAEGGSHLQTLFKDA